jgi:cytochrome c6
MRIRIGGSLVSLLFALAVPAVAFAAPDAKAVRMFKAKCATCHGGDGKGQTDKGKQLGTGDMTSLEWQTKLADARLDEVLGGGKVKDGKGKEVEHFSAKLTDAEKAGLKDVVRSFGGK